MKSALRSMVVVALVSASLVSSLLAEPPLADRLPAETVLYMGWAGQTLAYQGSHFGQLVAEPGLREIGHSVADAIDAAVEDEINGLPGEVSELAWLLYKRPTAFCALSIHSVETDIEQASLANIVPPMALVAELGSDQQAFLECLNRLATVMVEYDLAEVEPGKPDDPSSGALRLREVGLTLQWGVIDSLFYLTNDPGMPQRLTLAGQASENSLLHARVFADAHQQVMGEDEQGVVFVDLDALKSMVTRLGEEHGLPREQIGSYIDAAGLARATTYMCVTRISDRQLATKARLASPAPHEGILALYAGQTLPKDAFDFAQAESTLAATANVDLKALWGEVRRGVAKVDEDAVRQFDQAIAQVESMLGLSIQSDLLAVLGPRMSLVSADALGGPRLGSAAIIEVTAPEVFATTLAKLEGFANAALVGVNRSEEVEVLLDAYKVEPHAITCLRFKGAPVPFAPAWSLDGDRLVVALWPQVVEAVLADADPARLPTDLRFAAARDKLTILPTGIVYTDAPRVIRDAYPTAMMIWTMGANLLKHAGIDAKPRWLPPLPTILAHVEPSIEAFGSDEKGIWGESIVSVPGLDGLAITPSGGAQTTMLSASVMLPSLLRARELARGAVSMSQLNSIGKGIMFYRLDNDDRSPDSLHVLVEQGLISPDMLISPLSNEAAYVYFKLPAGTRADMVVAYEAPATHGDDTTGVLFMDGHVEQMEVDEHFWGLIERSKEAAEEVVDPSPYGQVEDEDF